MHAESSTASETTPLTVVVRRRIRRGFEADFERTMHEFIRFALDFPGHRGITVLRPGEGARDYFVIDKFRDETARRQFTATYEYRRWMESLAALSDGDTRIQEITGLEGWFKIAGRADPGGPKAYKMAIATFVGVYPLSVFLTLTIGRAIESWPLWAGSAVFNICIVTLLTWVVMPIVSRLLARWLYAGGDASGA